MSMPPNFSEDSGVAFGSNVYPWNRQIFSLSGQFRFSMYLKSVGGESMITLFDMIYFR